MSSPSSAGGPSVLVVLEQGLERVGLGMQPGEVRLAPDRRGHLVRGRARARARARGRARARARGRGRGRGRGGG